MHLFRPTPRGCIEEIENLGSKAEALMNIDDIFMIETPGGGGGGQAEE